MEGGVEDRDVRHLRHRNPRRSDGTRAPAPGGAARAPSARRAPRRRRRRSGRLAEQRPPWTTRWPTAATVGTSASDSTNVVTTSSSTTVQLEAGRPAVYDEKVAPWYETTSSRGSRDRLPRAPGYRRGPCSRRVLHLLAQMPTLVGDARNPVDRVHDEMEPVEVVQHRRCRTAWWSLPPCSRGRGGSSGGAPVREAVDQRRVAVIGEDDRGGVNSESALGVGRPCGCSCRAAGA